MLIRLRSRDGLERVNIPDKASVADLRNQISAQLSIPEDALILSTHQGLLLSKSPDDFTDMTDTSASLSNLGIAHGSVVFMFYNLERSVAGPAVMTPAGSFGKKMTMEDLIALQTRIERQEVAHCMSVSLDRDAANVFQQYVADSLAFSIKRGGFMYGRVEEGQVEVDFIYEPPQEGTEKTLHLIRDEDEERRVEAIASNLGLRRVGFIFTQSSSPSPRDFTLSGEEVKVAAELHAESELPEFVAATVKVAVGEGEGEGGAPSVHFEAFQMSDQCVRLAKEGWIVEGGEGVEPKFSKMRQNVVVAGRDVTEVDNDFFLVPVRILDHQGELKSIFPVENRLLGADGSHLRKQLDQFKSRPFYERIADFHILLFLSKFLDADTDIPQLAQAVRTHSEVPDGYQIIIESL